MLEHGVQKFMSDLNNYALKNMGLQASMAGLENHLHKANEDMSWVFSSGMTKVVDKLIAESFFYDANRDLHTICVHCDRREGYEMMNKEHNMGLTAIGLPLYDPTRFQNMEESFFTLFFVSTYPSSAFL